MGDPDASRRGVGLVLLRLQRTARAGAATSIGGR